jgi:hypothetical protein
MSQSSGSIKDHGKLPEHLKELYMSSKTDLNEEQQCKFFNLLIKYQNVFSKTDPI